MKKFYTLLFIATVSAGFSQSFSLYKTNGAGAVTATITNGAVIQEASVANGQVNTKIKIKNDAAVTQTFNVVRSVISSTPALDLSAGATNPTTYFCFGYTCFSSNVSTAGPQDYTILSASGQTSTTFPNADNSVDNAQPFSIYLDEGTSAGTYMVRYKVFRVDNVNDTVSFIISYNGPAGISKHVSYSGDLDVYPNPASSGLNVRIPMSASGPLELRMVNVSGQEVLSMDLRDHTGSVINVNTESFPSGIYFLSLTAGNYTAGRKVVIVK